MFFVGDSAGHCLPLTAEGIRTAFYFAIACGRELRAVVEGRASASGALERYGAFSAAHRAKFEAMLLAQRAVPRLHPRALAALVRAFGRRRLSHWGFGHYLRSRRRSSRCRRRRRRRARARRRLVGFVTSTRTAAGAARQGRRTGAMLVALPVPRTPWRCRP